MIQNLKVFFIAWPLTMVAMAIFGNFRWFTPFVTALGVIAGILLYNLVNAD